MKILPNITSLRFFLAILVVIFHLPEFCSNQNIPFYNSHPIFHKGTEAVYVFFSLSGFLIIRQLYIEKIKTKTISLKKFFTRRILRIFPLFLLILIFGLIYYNIILPKFGFPFESNYNIYEGILLSIFFLPNVFAILYKPGGIIEVLWSIGVEEQFYLFIAPMILFLPSKKIFYFLFLSTIVFLFLYFIETISLFRRFGMSFFYFTFSGLISLITLEKSFLFKNKIISILLSIIFITYFTSNIFLDNLTNEFYHIFSMVLFSIVLGFLSLTPYKIFENKILIYLGKISFGIYMYHSIVIQFIGLIYLKVFKIYSFNNVIIIAFYNLLVIIITILISHLSYKYFEIFFINKVMKTIKNK